eukprot:CAMPEP_0197302380 /NCGR_PEP_ID=MMETSP0890-20130614/51010_1 /TAXON_ID=44058 ORGANISM="Aureoumbra lagunensis, Strain CCMP1510" /NCGR_SAMPLE_ID=MMETSP0890 /ASSEMBLY_ACC=CAM_ASM_000533 /LENGTH=291 /DNA_ID=CAMNT_0042781965 /DNA_START=84 /DNA_END=956 /DNA_ORIENTATION=+
MSKIQTLTGHSGAVWALAFSPDGSILASGSSDTAVMFWDTKTGKNGDYNRIRTQYSLLVRTLAFSPDGSILASGSCDWDKNKTVMIWDVKNGNRIRTLGCSFQFLPTHFAGLFSSVHSDAVNALAFSPDGSILASGSCDWDKNKTVMIWDVKNGNRIRTLGCSFQFLPTHFAGLFSSVHSDAVNALAFSPDGSILASGSKDNTVMIWDTKNGNRIRTLSDHSGSIEALAFSPDGSILASGSTDKTVMIWGTKNGNRIRTLSDHSDFVLALAFSPDGSILASGSIDKTVIIW